MPLETGRGYVFFTLRFIEERAPIPPGLLFIVRRPPGSGTAIGILLIAAFVLLIAQQIVFVRLSAYRTDIRQGESPFAGRSRIAQYNYLRPGNYRPEGHRLLATFYTLQVLWLGALLALFSEFARRVLDRPPNETLHRTSAVGHPYESLASTSLSKHHRAWRAGARR